MAHSESPVINATDRARFNVLLVRKANGLLSTVEIEELKALEQKLRQVK